MTEPAEHEPKSRGDRAALVVIDDHPGVGAHPGVAHLLLELRSGGQRMPAWSCSSHRVHLDEDSARDVPTQILVAAVASGQVPAKVDQADILVADMVAQPDRLDKGPKDHGAVTTRVSWQKWTA